MISHSVPWMGSHSPGCLKMCLNSLIESMVFTFVPLVEPILYTILVRYGDISSPKGTDGKTMTLIKEFQRILRRPKAKLHLFLITNTNLYQGGTSHHLCLFYFCRLCFGTGEVLHPFVWGPTDCLWVFSSIQNNMLFLVLHHQIWFWWSTTTNLYIFPTVQLVSLSVCLSHPKTGLSWLTACLYLLVAYRATKSRVAYYFWWQLSLGEVLEKSPGGPLKQMIEASSLLSRL